MLLIEKMEMGNFSNNEQVVVEYLLNKGLEIEPMSTTDIANATFVAKSTLVRIAKKLGFNGWTDFKEAFLNEKNYQLKQVDHIDANLPFEKNDNLKNIATKLARLEQETIEETLSLINYKDLQQAINLLSKAQTTHIFAVSNNLHLSKEFEHNMNRIKHDVRVHNLQGETFFNAFLVKDTDCAVILSYSGGTSSLLTAMHYLKKHKVPIILITSIGDNPSTSHADTILRITTKEKLYSKIATFSTDTSINYLFNLLYSGVFAKKYDENLKLRIETAKAVEIDRVSSSKILDEK